MTIETRRPITTEGFTPPKMHLTPGSAPVLQWVDIAQLVVDETYQRPITGAGVGNIKKIAAAFEWSKFAPVIVAPVEGGKYAIVDGQHRTTAAALAGIKSVPCQIIFATPGQQAAAFKAVNAHVTRVSSLSIFNAAVAAGDPEAVAVVKLCADAGVTLLRYPKDVATIKAGETMAVATIANRIKLYGSDVVSLALKCITKTSNNKPGGVNAVMIAALCGAIAPNRAWRSCPNVMISVCDKLNLQREHEKVASWPREKGVPLELVLTRRVEEVFRQAFAK